MIAKGKKLTMYEAGPQYTAQVTTTVTLESLSPIVSAEYLADCGPASEDFGLLVGYSQSKS
jgi:hypothetical protein